MRSTNRNHRSSTKRARDVPHSIEIERDLIGAALWRGDLRAFADLPQDLFFYEQNRTIHRIASEMLAKCNGNPEPFTEATLAFALQQAGELDAIGGNDYLLRAIEYTPGAHVFEAMAGKLSDLAVCRRMMDAAQDLHNAAVDTDLPKVDELLQNTCRVIRDRVPGAERQLFLPIRHFLSQETDPQWLVRNLIPSGGIIALAAAPKKGKTLAAFEIARAVALGDAAFSYFAVSQGTVLILEHDQRPAVSQTQLRKLGFNGFRNVHIRHDRLTVKDIHAIRREIERIGARLFIVDTLLRFIDVDDENASAKIDAAMQPILEVASATGCAFLMIHHAKKGSGDGGSGGEELRGSSAIYGCVEGRLSLVKVRRVDGALSATLETESKCTAPQNWRMTLDPDSLRWQVTGTDDGTDESDRAAGAILEALERLGEASAQQLADAIGISRRTVLRAIGRMPSQVIIVRKEGKTPIYGFATRDSSQEIGANDANHPTDFGAGFSGSTEDFEGPERV